MDNICYIVGAGENFGLDFVPAPEDLLIAADGGYRAVLAAGLRPDVVIGDFDSLGAAPSGAEVITLPTVKDVTDTWAAIDLGIQRGYRRFFLYGCTGGRFDHTLANIQTVADAAMRSLECRLFDRAQVITAICRGSLHFDETCKGFLSVFAHSDLCTGVTLRGFKYPLENAELTNRFPLGVSNEFLGTPADLSVKTGTLILVYDRNQKISPSSLTTTSF